MTTILAIYLAGALFFLLQAYIHARVSRERIIGALTWPLLLFIIPYIVRAYRVGRDRMEPTLRYDERMGIKSMRIGDRWGINA
jgi:hypothetical protein